MANSRNRALERQSWKRASAADKRSPKSQRWLFTLLAIGLSAVLAYYLRPHSPVQVQFVSLEVNDYAKLVVPQLPSDTSALISHDDGRLRFLHYKDLSDSLDAPLGGLKQIGSICDASDRLVVYLCAHLVPSSDGSIDVLLRNYDINTAESRGENASSESPVGSYPLQEILERMRASSATVKLLLIDSGRLTIDSRLALLGNQAYSLFDDQLRKINDPNLAIIVSCRQSESASGWYGRPQLFFGQAVIEAFRGEADENDDDWLTVGEVYDYLARQCYFHSGETQLPMLFAAIANLDQFRSSRLFAVEPLVVNEDHAVAESDNAGSTDAADQPTEASKKTDTQASDTGTLPSSDAAGSGDSSNVASAQATDGAGNAATATESSTTSNNEVAAKPGDAGDVQNTARENQNQNGSNDDADAPSPMPDGSQSASHYLQLVDDAWDLRDRIISERSAVEAVPHLCRELDARILDFEMRFHGAPPSESTTNLLQDLVQSLKTISDVVPVGQTNVELAQRLATGLRSYQPFENRSLRDMQRIAYLARDYVDWHGKIAFLLSENETNAFASSLESLINDINAFGPEPLTNEKPDSSPTGDGGPVVLNETLEQDLRESARRINNAQRDVHAKWMSLVENALERIDDPRSQCVVEATLGSRVPDAPLRRRLRSLLLQHRVWTPKAHVINLPSMGGGDSELSGSLIRHAKLERLLAPRDVLAQAGFDDWPSLLEAGKKISQYYRGLPASINSSPNSNAVWDMIAVDYRDAAAVTIESTSQLPVRFSPRPVFALVDSPPQSVELSPDGSKLLWKFNNTTSNPITARCSYDSQNVAIFDSDQPDAKRIESGTEITLPRSDVAIQWTARSTSRERTAQMTTEMQCIFRSGDKSLPQTIFLTQVVNDVDLIVYHHTLTDVQQSRDKSLVFLKPFPNRTSRFRFELRNRSKSAKTITAKIGAVPRTDVTPGRIADQESQVLDAIRRSVVVDGQLARNVRIVAETISPISIPPDDALPLILGPPGSARGQAADVESPVAAAPAEPPSSAGVDLSYGLVCEVTEMSADGSVATRWLKWLEIRPMEPSEYLTCVPKYDAGEFSATIEAKRNLLPRKESLEESPISVSWDTSPITEPTGFVGSGIITDASKSVLVRGKFEPPASVWLNVDGYPRAFLFEVRQSGRIDPGPTQADVRILSLSHPDFKKVYVLEGAIKESWPKAAEGQRYMNFRRSSLLAFPKVEGPVTLRFQVDAPHSTFGLGDLRQKDRDMVRLDPNGVFDMPVSYDDRQVRTTLTKIEGDTIALTCEVSDFESQIREVAISEPERLQIVTYIDGVTKATDEVRVVFASSEPRVDLSILPSSVEVDQDFKVTVTARDPSDIDRIEVGIVDQQDAPLTNGKVENDGKATFEFKAPKEDGSYWIKAVAVSGALITGEKTARLRVRAKVEPGEAPPPPPPKYTVKGNVYIGVNLRNDIEVSLKGKTFVTKSDGSFILTEIPPGDANLAAKAKFQGRNYTIEVPVVLPMTGPDKVVDIGEVKLERKE